MPRRGIRQRMTLAQRHQAIGMLEGVASLRQVVTRFGISSSVTSRLWRRYQETGITEERPRSGRSRCTTQREDRLIVLSARSSPHSSTVSLNRIWVRNFTSNLSESPARRWSTCQMTGNSAKIDPSSPENPPRVCHSQQKEGVFRLRPILWII